MISVLPCDSSLGEKANDLFDSIFPVAIQDKKGLQKAVENGIFQVCKVDRDGETMLVIWFSVSKDNGLWVHAVTALKDFGDCLDLVFEAGDILKRKHNCLYQRFMTCRKGLIQAASKKGFKVDGIILSK